jgi:predicted permease
LSHSLWQERFGGDRGIVGRRLRLDGVPYTVAGVMPAGFRFPSQTDAWVPSSGWADQWPHRNIRVSSAVGRLAPGADLASLRREAAAVSAGLERQYPETNTGVVLEATRLREVTVGSSRQGLLLLLVAGLFLLLITAANSINLLLIHLSARTSELATRIAMGATPASLVRKQILRSSLLALATGGLAALIAGLTLPWVRTLLPPDLPDWVSIRLDEPVLLVAFAGALVVTVVTETLPLLLFLRRDASRSLSRQTRSVSADQQSLRSRRILAAVQLCLALLLTSCGWLLLTSYRNLRATDPGFDPEHVVTAEVDLPELALESYQQVTATFREVAERLNELPVAAAALSTSLPLTGQEVWEQWEVTTEGQTEAEARSNPRVHGQGISPSYFAAMRIPRLAGRVLEAGDDQAENGVVVISQRLAETFWPGQEAVGKRLHLGGPAVPAPWLTVVGVVGNVRGESLAGAGGRDLYLPLTRLPSWPVHVIVRERPEVPLAAESIRRRIWEVSPDLGVRSIVPLADRIARTLWQSRAWAALSGILAVLGLALGLVGTFVVLGHLLEQRQRELSIRVAFGADRRDISRIVLGETLRLLLIGGLAGLAAALLLGRYLEAQLFGVEALDPGALAGAAAAVALISTIATWLPLRRALRLDSSRHLQEL